MTGRLLFRIGATIFSMIEHEVTRLVPLLGRDGRIIEEGWARRPMWAWSRPLAKGGRLAVKEWDYYALLNPAKNYAVCLTMSDLGYAALFAVCFVDLARGASAQTDVTELLTLHRTGLPASSTADSHTAWTDRRKRMTMTFIRRAGKRHIIFNAPSLVLPDGSEGLLGDFTVLQPPSMESMNIATSWAENRRRFYLNEKVVGMKASEGFIRRGGVKDEIASDGALAVLDWGRGSWTRKNTWWWASGASGNIGINLGYGFTDRSPASENAFFVDGKLHKLGEVGFTTSDDLSKPWIMKDKEGRLDLVFTPAAPRRSKTDLKVIVSVQDQYFGRYDGQMVTESGRRIQVDGMMGFAERVYNKW